MGVLGVGWGERDIVVFNSGCHDLGLLQVHMSSGFTILMLWICYS